MDAPFVRSSWPSIVWRRIPLTYKYEKHNPASANAMENEKICSSCGVRLIGKSTTFFLCPNCGKTEIGRCPNCRDQSVTYVCAKCGFSGP